MRCQKIITENGKDYLVIAMPTLPELFGYGFVSKSGKSFVYRKYSFDKETLYGYVYAKFNPELLKGRIINSHNHFHSGDFETHEFNGIGLPCLKIFISKKF